MAENGRLRAENTHLREEIEQLKRQNARSAAPFSKHKRKKDPKRPGRKPGQGEFRHRSGPQNIPCIPGSNRVDARRPP
jgi:hypothetical protein